MSDLRSDRSGSVTDRVMVAGGLGLMVLFGAGILVAGFLPPISPDLSAEQVAAVYTEDANRIRAGSILMLAGACFAIPFFASISAAMRRMRGGLDGLCLAQAIAGAIATLVFTIPVLFFAAAAYRPAERDPQLTQAINDIGWFFFLMNVWTVTIQAVIIAVAVFSDPAPEPVFPRWVGYVNIWCALAFIPGGFLCFFRTGPLAWDGALSWWLAATFFFLWIAMLSWAGMRANSRSTDTSEVVA